MKGILGRKAGMTQVFTKEGHLIPVTVVEVQTNVVTQVKTESTDGYNSLQLSVGDQKEHRVANGSKGHFKKANTAPKRFTKEIREMSGFELGAQINGSTIFEAGEFVDATGISKGKGFAGPMKRHNQKRQGRSNVSQSTRAVGSMGDIEGNKVSKGKNMPGQMGYVQKTIQNLEVVSVDDANSVILVKGSVPGPNKGWVVLQSAVKKNGATTNAAQLIDLQEAEKKNALIEEATHYAAEVNTDMSIEDMKDTIEAAKAAREAEKAAAEAAKAAEEAAAKEAKAAEVAEDKVETAEAKEEANKEDAEEAKAEAEVAVEAAEEAAEEVKEAKEEVKEAIAEEVTKKQEEAKVADQAQEATEDAA